MLPKHEEKAYIQIREEEIRKKWDNYQKGKSLQQTFTPLSLTYEMLQKLPSLEGKDVLVVSNIETVLFLRTLKRDGYVNFDKLHFLTDIKKLEGKEGVSYISFDELDKVNLGMKFDVVIGNPPYSQGKSNTDLYNVFVEQSLVWSNHLVMMVTPARFVTSRKPSMVQMRKKINAFGLSKFVSLDDMVFGSKVSISGGVCYFICDNLSSSTIEDHLDTKEMRLFKKMKAYNNKPVNFYRGGLQILEKDTDLYSQVPTEEFNTPHLIRIKDGSPLQVYVQANKSKVREAKFSVIFSERGGLVPKCKIYKGSFTAAINVCSVAFNTKEECLNFINFTNSTIFKFMSTISQNKNNASEIKTVVNNPGWFREVCLNIDFTRSWTDVELYRFLGLLQEEINLIESTVK